MLRVCFGCKKPDRMVGNNNTDISEVVHVEFRAKGLRVFCIIFFTLTSASWENPMALYICPFITAFLKAVMSL